MVSTK